MNALKPSILISLLASAALSSPAKAEIKNYKLFGDPLMFGTDHYLAAADCERIGVVTGDRVDVDARVKSFRLILKRDESAQEVKLELNGPSYTGTLEPNFGFGAGDHGEVFTSNKVSDFISNIEVFIDSNKHLIIRNDHDTAETCELKACVVGFSGTVCS